MEILTPDDPDYWLPEFALKDGADEWVVIREDSGDITYRRAQGEDVPDSKDSGGWAELDEEAKKLLEALKKAEKKAAERDGDESSGESEGEGTGEGEGDGDGEGEPTYEIWGSSEVELPDGQTVAIAMKFITIKGMDALTDFGHKLGTEYEAGRGHAELEVRLPDDKDQKDG